MKEKACRKSEQKQEIKLAEKSKTYEKVRQNQKEIKKIKALERNE